MASIESGIQKLARPVRVGPVLRSRSVERFYPRVGAFLVLGAWWFIGQPMPPQEVLSMAMISSLTLAAIFTGFAGTATAVMIGMETRVMEKIRTSSAIEALAAYVMETIVAGMIVAVCAFLSFFWGHPVPTLLSAVWILGVALLALCFFRLSYILVGFLGVSRKSKNE